MKEAIVHGGEPLTIQIIDSPIPEPRADEVLIKVVYSGSNSKDWKYPFYSKKPANSGDDVVGYVEKVGTDVYEFQKGQKVAAFHVMYSPGGSFAEYSIAPAHATFHLPASVSMAEAASIPLAAMTAALGLFANLQLPSPWSPAIKKTPLVVYGASSAVGAFAIKLATRSNIHPIIAIAGKGKDFVENLVDRSKGDVVLDYRDGNEHLIRGIEEALRNAAEGGETQCYAFDAIAEHGSPELLSKVLPSGAHLTFVLPNLDYSHIRDDIITSVIAVGYVHHNEPDDNDSVKYVTTVNGRDFGFLYFRLFAQGLKDGWLQPHPVMVVPGGLSGVAEGLNNLREGRASAVKYVFKIEDTPGIAT